MSELKTIRVFDQRYEAELVQGLLSAEGVESIIVADDCGGQRPDLSVRSKGVQLVIREEDIVKAKSVLEMLDEESSAWEDEAGEYI